jgi:hypothetical protein
LQLTHSGRWSRPDGTPRPIIVYHHPLLDRRAGGAALAPITDDALDELREAFVRAALLARDAGFGFVDVKHCHGYLLHELLSADARARTAGRSRTRSPAFSSAISGAAPGCSSVAERVRLRAVSRRRPDIGV